MQKQTVLFFLLLALICFAPVIYSADRSVGPIGVGQPTQADRDRAKRIGIVLSRPYSVTKVALIKAGWKIDLEFGFDEQVQPAYPKHPEITCGNGMDAICSARYKKNDQSIMLTLDTENPSLLVAHVEYD